MKRVTKIILALALLLTVGTSALRMPVGGAEGAERLIVLHEVRAEDQLIFSASLTGYPSEYRLQWQMNGQNIMEATDSKLSMNAIDAAGSLRLSVVFVDENGAEQTEYSKDVLLSAETAATATTETIETETAETAATATTETTETETAETAATATTETIETETAETTETAITEAAAETIAEPTAENKTITEEEIRAILENNGARVKVGISWGDKAFPEMGDPFVVKAEIRGYEGLVYTLRWQEKTRDGEWADIPGATEPELRMTISETNQHNTWRIMVDVQGLAPAGE